MTNKVLISHSHSDKELAGTLAELIRRVTLGQVSVWYSSDVTGQGGIGVGERWNDSIRANLQNCQAVIALLTPVSLPSPWIYFESGFGAAIAELEVIPVCVGIDSLSGVPGPLAPYQSYQLTDSSSLTLFLRKLLAKFSIPFDEEMAQVAINPAIPHLVTYASGFEEQRDAGLTMTLPTLLEEIKTHIDRRIVHLTQTEIVSTERESYNVNIEFEFPKIRFKDFLIINSDSTVQDVLDNLYSRLRGQVPPHTYLEKWVIYNPKSNRHVIIREIASLVPAECIFSVGSSWSVKPLDKPYESTDSSKRVSSWRKL